jgi:hypothetical protein
VETYPIYGGGVVMSDLIEIKSKLLAEIVERVGDPVATMADIQSGLETLWNDANTSGDQQKAELVNAVWERAQQLATANNMLIDVTATAREALEMTKDEYQSIVNALAGNSNDPRVNEFVEQLEADIIEWVHTDSFVSEDPGFDMCELGGLDVEPNDAQVFHDLLFGNNGHYHNADEKLELEQFITEFVGKYTDRYEAEQRDRERAWKVRHESAD